MYGKSTTQKRQATDLAPFRIQFSLQNQNGMYVSIVSYSYRYWGWQQITSYRCWDGSRSLATGVGMAADH